ncbi:MAG: hypothetical protein LBE85_01385 [Candidatus Accumulibacter sp.]|jgi:hypothetical protein|nr:hypothetical protein [Accumulibacter sp.]
MTDSSFQRMSRAGSIPTGSDGRNRVAAFPLGIIPVHGGVTINLAARNCIGTSDEDAMALGMPDDPSLWDYTAPLAGRQWIQVDGGQETRLPANGKREKVHD